MKIFWARVLPFLLFMLVSLMLLGKAEAVPTRAELLDVSSWQGDINWSRVARDGISGSYLKITEGADYRDPSTTRQRLNSLKSANLYYGFYHFLRPKKRDAAVEARWFISQSRALGGWGSLLPAIDIEDTKLKKAATGNYLARFIQVLREEGGTRKVLIYASPLWWQKNVGLTPALRAQLVHARAWIAHWNRETPDALLGLRGYALHQYTSKGSAAGIRGYVDRNRTQNLGLLLR